MAAGHSVDPARWRGLLDAGLTRVAGQFARVEPLRTATAPFGSQLCRSGFTAYRAAACS
jgi:hypothetical protein